MGFFDFMKLDQSLEKLSEMISAAIALSNKENHSFPPLNNAGEFELFLFNIALGWDILLDNKKIKPTDSIITKKNEFILERAKIYQLEISNNDIYSLYQKRYIDYKKMLDYRVINKHFGKTILFRYLYSTFYLTPLNQSIDFKSSLPSEMKRNYDKFSDEFLIYYRFAHKFINSKVR